MSLSHTCQWAAVPAHWFAPCEEGIGPRVASEAYTCIRCQRAVIVAFGGRRTNYEVSPWKPEVEPLVEARRVAEITGGRR